jgi:hypothetical protein
VDSWWRLGEGSGHFGSRLDVNHITCPFCLESGNFTIEHHAEKRKANSKKVLNFDTLRCGNCVGYVLALWSGNQAFHAFKVMPWPLSSPEPPAHWPEAVARCWVQAHRGAEREDWDSAVVMARSSMQGALREQGANGKNLRQEIDDLASRGILPPHMKEWAHELRAIGNESAHPLPHETKAEAEDVRDVIEFLDFLLQYLYDLPQQIKAYRARGGGNTESESS